MFDEVVSNNIAATQSVQFQDCSISIVAEAIKGPTSFSSLDKWGKLGTPRSLDPPTPIVTDDKAH